jgi:hypothetical protein
VNYRDLDSLSRLTSSSISAIAPEKPTLDNSRVKYSLGEIRFRDGAIIIPLRLEYLYYFTAPAIGVGIDAISIPIGGKLYGD